MGTTASETADEPPTATETDSSKMIDDDEEHRLALKQKSNRRKSFNTKQKALSQKMEDMLQSYGLIDNDEVDAQEDWGGQSDWLTPQVPSRTKETTDVEETK